MRVLLVSTYFPPQNAAGSLRAHAFARYWARAGAEVTVLTAAKRDGQDGLSPPAEGFALAEVPFRLPRLLERVRRSERDSLEVGEAGARRGGAIARWLRALRDRTGAFHTVRMPDLTDFWVRPARAWARAHGPWDAVVSSSGPYTVHLVARTVRESGRARLWAADFRDLWTANEPYRGLFPFTLLERRLERRCLAAADLLTTVSRPLASRLAAQSGKPAAVVYNGHDPELGERLDRRPAFPADGRLRLVFTGGLYPQRQEPEHLLAALVGLKESRPGAAARLCLAVAGPRREEWRRLAAAWGLGDMLEHAGPVAREAALRMQRDAGALVFLDWKDPGAGVLSSKLFEYLFARAPVLAVGGSPASGAGEILSRSGRGVHLGRDVAAIRGALECLLEDRPLGGGGRDDGYLLTFTREHQSHRYLRLLEEGLAARALAGRASAGSRG